MIYYEKNLNWGLFSKYRSELYGIATLMIMIFHSQVIIVLPGWFNAINSHLNYGVDIFLFLSGISLYFSYSKDGNYGNFIKKRYERTLYPYLIIGLFFWIWRFIIAEYSLSDFMYNASGLSLFLVRDGNSLTLGKTLIWYVAFIMGVYALYPLFYNAFFKVTPRKKNVNCTAFIFASVILTIFLKLFVPDTFTRTEVWLTRIPVFIIGCYFGRAVSEKRSFRIMDYVLFFLFIPVKAAILFLRTPENKVFLNRYAGLFGALLVYFAAVFIFEKLGLKPIRYICRFFGKLSLEIYMIHVLLYTAVTYYIPDIRTDEMFSQWQRILIYCGVLVVSVILSFIFNKVYNILLKKHKKNFT